MTDEEIYTVLETAMLTLKEKIKLAENKITPKRVLTAFSKDEDGSVRERGAENPYV